MHEPGVCYAQSDLTFDEQARKIAETRAVYESATAAASQIREWLATHRGPYAKDEIIAGAGVDPDEWSSAIKELVESGAIVKQGVRRGTKYSLGQG